MLRQALDAAEGKKKQEEEEAAAAAVAAALTAPTETSSLDGGAARKRAARPKYGAVDDDEEDDSVGEDEDDDDGEYSDEWEDEEDEEEEEKPPSTLVKMWQAVKSFILIVANVDGLWDSTESSSAIPSRTRLIVLFWFVVLAGSYALERSTFKVLVDKAGPFRLFSVEMVTAIHSMLLGIGLIFSCCLNRGGSNNNGWDGRSSDRIGLGISIVDVGLMALLDTVTLLLVFLTALHVPPTLTVILVQFTLPLTAFLTQFVHPDGRCSCVRQPETEATSDHDSRSPPKRPDDEMEALYEHIDEHKGDDVEPPRHTDEGQPLKHWGGLSAPHLIGSIIIFVAVFLSLCPAFYAIADPDFFIYADTIPIRTAYNTLLYVSSCIPAAASQLYKEHVFLQYKQPVNVTYLNLLLSVFQFVFATIMSPLVFNLQGLGGKGDWTKLYPSSDFSENFLDGFRCFFRLLSDEDQEFKYFEDARCDFALGLVVFHALAIVGVGLAVDKIVNAGATKVMYRGMSAGIIVAVLCMHDYDMHITEFSYGPIIDALNLVSLILLILGAEVYHRVGLQESTFETVYPTIQNFYQDD